MVKASGSLLPRRAAKLLLFASLLTPVLGHAAAITTSVICTQNFNHIVVSNAASCTLQATGTAPSSDGYATATTAVSYAVAGNQFVSDISGFVSAATVSVFSPASTAQADASLGVNLYTRGPVRAGVVKVLPGGGWGGSTGGNGAGITSWSLQPTILSYSCTGAICGGPAPFSPFTLGTSLVFDETMNFEAMGYGFSTSASVGGDTALTFQFFEADGVTPVSVYEAPEQASLALMAIGCFALLARKRCFTFTRHP